MITVFKLEHRGAFRIGIRFKYNVTIKAKLYKIGATYSATHRCYYLNYTKENYALLQNRFDEIKILKNTTNLKSIYATGNSQVPSHIVSSNDRQLIETKTEHKFLEKKIAQQLNFKLLPDVGKYWVIKLHYQGHNSIKTTMVYTHIAQGAIDKITSPLDILVHKKNKLI